MPQAIKIKRQVGRPSATGKALENWLLDVAKFFQQWQFDNNRFSADDSESSMNMYEVDVSKAPDSGSVSGASWAPFAIQGRGPGKFPPATIVGGRVRWLQLEEWAVRKMITISEDIGLASLGFLIARKISEKGTLTRSGDIKLTDRFINQIISDLGFKHLDVLGDELADEVADQLVDVFTKNTNFKEV